MRGKITRVVESGNFSMYLIWLSESNSFARTYTGSGYRNYTNWKDLKVGDFVQGLEWKDLSRKILDADSPVHPID